MNGLKRWIAVVLMCLCASATFALSGCGGDVAANIGAEYKTKWFSFTVNSMTTETSYGGYNAASGNLLLVANVTITNTLTNPQSFGTWDFWYVSTDVFRFNKDLPLYSPMSPLKDNTVLPNNQEAANGVTFINSQMMPDDFYLSPGDSATYDIVIEFPKDMSSPLFIFTEIDENERLYKSFKFPI